MIRLLVVALALIGFQANAQDLESILDGKADTQQSRNSSFLADSIRSLVGATTPEQNFFLRNLERSEWSEALIAWNSAFGGKPFERTESGQALRAFLQFKSGLTITGIESLFAIKDPKKIHFQILTLWRESANESHKAWLVARLEWSQVWSELFGNSIEVKVKAADLSGSHKLDELNALAMLAPPESRERAMIDWHLALTYAMKDQADKSAKIMSSLLKAKNNPISTDLLNLSAARMLYQNGYFEAAQKYYDKVPKSSEDYLEAQEEKAWTYLRRGQPQDALAVTQSLVNPVFSGQVGSETWFLRALSQLKVCDYNGTFGTLNGFSKEFKDHTIALEKLSAGKAGMELLESFMQKMKTGTVTRAEMVRSTRDLPRNLTRDEKLRHLLMAQSMLEAEATSAERLFAESLKTTGFQGHFDTLRGQVAQRMQNAKAASIGRAHELARLEMEETKKMVNKMHIVEAELVQRIDAAPRISKYLGKPDAKVGTTGSVARDTLTFPYEKELWFDELSNYKVDIKNGCQTKVVR